MNLEVIDAVIFIAGAAVGLFIGMSFKKENKPATNNTILTPDAIQHELDKQQVAIDSFFEETENALEQAESTVAKLRNKIASGALELSNVAIDNNSNVINTPKAQEESTPVAAEPPRDYALKSDTQSPGTLSEEFGFDKEQEKAGNS